MTILPFPTLMVGDGLSWSQRTVADTCVLSLAGDLDYSTGCQLREVLVRISESSAATTIVLDMSRVGFLDACGVGVIVQGATLAQLDGRTLHVAGLHGLPRRVFTLVGLDHMTTGSPVSAHLEGVAMSRAGDGTTPPGAQEQARHADVWERGAEERERLADERERIADERERVADEREVLADQREHLADREDHRLDGREARHRRIGTLKRLPRTRQPRTGERATLRHGRLSDGRERGSDWLTRRCSAPRRPPRGSRHGRVGAMSEGSGRRLRGGRRGLTTATRLAGPRSGGTSSRPSGSAWPTSATETPTSATETRT